MCLLVAGPIPKVRDRGLQMDFLSLFFLDLFLFLFYIFPDLLNVIRTFFMISYAKLFVGEYSSINAWCKSIKCME